MIRSFTYALVTFGAVAALSAQAPTTERPTTQPAAPAAEPSTQPPAGQSAMPAAAADKETWRGCLKPGLTAGSWVLDSAEMAPAGSAAKPSDSPVGTAGTAMPAPGAPMVPSAKKSLNLKTKATDNLAPHANHQVEVVGSLSAMAPAAGAPAAGSTTAASTPSFNVDSFKMISATCQ